MLTFKNVSRMLMSLVLVGASPQVYAKSALDEVCKDRYDLAEGIITSRMNGESLPEMLSSFSGILVDIEKSESHNDKLTKKVNRYIHDLILTAYEEPVLSVVELNERAIKRFSEQVMIDCYRNNGEL
ncbi:hypothetical protein N0382_003442 [Vibrio cholerae]|uniref:hypothetical protein n=1 Tax=Vibrio cholerae TaxID=666 RepID=UPI001157489F|nr:hypothetical protein [Vibrio cholerae]EGR0469068.1 hypothetical protein [Vibrio cholerae]EGR0582285.1 hypothetical protein [Vibrio cholerae]EJL6579360.1 hypothetical protein [Vibrio cholerae]EJL6615653.1 hypothetical protein [Vibrio cholerae]EJL6845298.1 hypothetical protein [Vibrio cholerae]